MCQSIIVPRLSGSHLSPCHHPTGRVFSECARGRHFRQIAPFSTVFPSPDSSFLRITTKNAKMTTKAQIPLNHNVALSFFIFISDFQISSFFNFFGSAHTDHLLCLCRLFFFPRLCRFRRDHCLRTDARGFYYPFWLSTFQRYRVSFQRVPHSGSLVCHRYLQSANHSANNNGNSPPDFYLFKKIILNCDSNYLPMLSRTCRSPCAFASSDPAPLLFLTQS